MIRRQSVNISSNNNGSLFLFGYILSLAADSLMYHNGEIHKWLESVDTFIISKTFKQFLNPLDEFWMSINTKKLYIFIKVHWNRHLYKTKNDG